MLKLFNMDEEHMHLATEMRDRVTSVASVLYQLLENREVVHL